MLRTEFRSDLIAASMIEPSMERGESPSRIKAIDAVIARAIQKNPEAFQDAVVRDFKKNEQKKIALCCGLNWFKNATH